MIKVAVYTSFTSLYAPVPLEFDYVMNTQRTISSEIEPEEIFLDQALRPQSLNALIGQDRVRENIRILIEAANGREEALEHV